MKEVPQSPVVAAVESAKSNTTQPADPSPAADPKLDAYEKKERQLRAMMKQLQSERSTWEQQRQAKDQDYTQNYIPKNRLAEDTLGALQEAGITTEKLTELLLNPGSMNDPAIRALKAELQGIKDSQKQQVEQQEQAVKAQYEQAKKQISNEVKLLIDSKSEEYEAIKEAGLQDAVVELIEDTFNREGYLMDVEEAASQVEAHLIEESLKLARLKKVQSKLQPTEPAAAKEVSLKQQSPSGSQTLTNSMASAAPQRKLTEKERRERALAAFHGKLNT